ncbi:unnamed protein product [Schistocephalus solidus]|uniref:Uncharacterized protein n=1 Tax=Schistocephalus solidus TaxID=70667 RepID=A0A183SSX2_SCHSO|nr:unnamed protein product [Schistocephalus solidus]
MRVHLEALMRPADTICGVRRGERTHGSFIAPYFGLKTKVVSKTGFHYHPRFSAVSMAITASRSTWALAGNSLDTVPAQVESHSCLSPFAPVYGPPSVRESSLVAMSAYLDTFVFSCHVTTFLITGIRSPSESSSLPQMVTPNIRDTIDKII